MFRHVDRQTFHFDDGNCVRRQVVGALLKCYVIAQRLCERRYGNGPKWTVKGCCCGLSLVTGLDNHCVSSCTARWRGVIM